MQIISMPCMHAECCGVSRSFIAKPPQKVHIYHWVLYSMQLFFWGLVTIIFVDILKVGGVDKTIWQTKFTGQYLGEKTADFNSLLYRETTMPLILSSRIDYCKSH